MRLLPPLNVTAEVVDIACDILVEAVESCTEHRAEHSNNGRPCPAEGEETTCIALHS